MAITQISKLPTGQTIGFGTAAPSLAGEGQFQVGDICINSGGVTATPIGWRCTAAGTPGTWEGIGTSLIPITLYLEDGAAAANYQGRIATVPVPMRLMYAYERHLTAGSDGGAVTLDIMKAPSATAIGSGTTMLAATFNLKGTADTNQAGSLSATSADRNLAAGDSIGLVPAGTMTAVDGVSVTLWLMPL